MAGPRDNPEIDLWQEFDNDAVRNLKITLIERYKDIFDYQNRAGEIGMSDEDGKFCHGGPNSDASYTGSLMLRYGGFDYRVSIESPEWPSKYRVNDTTVKIYPQLGIDVDVVLQVPGEFDDQLYAASPLFWEGLIKTGEPIKHKYISC